MRGIKTTSYDSYKKSSVAYIEYIPSHWSIYRIKDLIHGIDQGWSPNAENRLVTENEWGVLKLSAINNGKYNENKHKALPIYEIPKHQYLVKRGYLLLTRSNTPNLVGDCCLVTEEPTLKMMYSDLIYNLKINKRKALDRYLNYFLSCESFRRVKTVSARGLNDSMVKISQGIIRGWTVFSPPSSEQKDISDFLDNITGQIDRKIDLLSQKASLYVKLKQSLINETITRGLDKTVVMKDSGVNWIGEIPEHWSIERIGTAFEERREKVNDTDYPPLSVTMRGIVPQLDTAAKTDHNDNRKRVAINDFVINSRSDRRGSSGVSELNGSVSLINIVLSPRKGFYGKYLHHLFRSYRFVEGFYRVGRGIVDDLWTTNYSVMKAISFPFPDYEEQKAIADHLDEKTGHIDRIVETINTQIDKLKELRKTLINDVVTGKIRLLKRGEQYERTAFTR